VVSGTAASFPTVLLAGSWIIYDSSRTPMRVRASDRLPCPAAPGIVSTFRQAAAADIGHRNASERRRRRDAVVIIIAENEIFWFSDRSHIGDNVMWVHGQSTIPYVKPISFVCFFFHTRVTFSFFSSLFFLF